MTRWRCGLITCLLFVGCDEPDLPPIQGVEITVTDDNFEREVLGSERPVLIDFGAEWCPPCQRMKNVVAHLSLNYEGRLKVGKVDVDDSRGLASEYGIGPIPALVLFQDGKEVDRTTGYRSLGKLSNWVDERIGPATSGDPIGG